MKKLMLWLIAFAAVPAGELFAQNIVGTWQGTLQVPQAPMPLRLVLKISRAENESLKGVFYSIDQNPTPINASAITQQGVTLKMSIAAIGGEYEGKMSADGATVNGTWSQGGGAPLVLNFDRATPANTWAIPDPPPPPTLMPADATPLFEVATIKPSRPDAQGQSILVGRGGTNMFTTTNTPLSDLIVFAYGLHARQVTGGPSWMESERFDITGKPDRPGMPSVNQLKTMVQKLLEERFKLTFHHDKKELSVYAITVVKTGPKMNKVEGNRGILPGFGGRGPGAIGVQNSTMEEFAGFLQSRILDRPVVDQTGLTDRYNFTLRWTPDSAQQAAAAPNTPPAATSPDAPPDLFAAFQQQLGLKLEATKAPVTVFVIDRAEKPSEN